MDEQRFLDLLEGYIEGTLDDARRAELEAIILGHPEARRMFWEYLEQHAHVRELSVEARGRAMAGLERPRRPAPPQTSRFAPALFAAALLIGLITLLFTLSSPAPVPGKRAEERAAQAREERVRLETNLAEKSEERRRLEEAKQQAANAERLAELKQREAELERTVAEFRARIEAAMKRERDALAEVPRITPAPPEKVAPSPERPSTQVAAVKVERAQRASVKEGDVLGAGQGVSVAPGGHAILVYADATRLEIRSNSEVKDLQTEGGKRLVVVRGTVEAVVARQNQPMVFSTLHGEATVLGTTLRIIVDQGTRLEVDQGKVRLKNLAGKTVDVLSGHYAVAAAGAPLVSNPMTSGPAVVSFTLINADTEQPIAEFDPIKEGAVLTLSKLPTKNLNVRANVMPRKVGSVRFALDGVEMQRVENGTTAPVYSLAGDLNGKYNAWVPAPGVHTVKATPYPEPEAKGPSGTSFSVTFRVEAR